MKRKMWWFKRYSTPHLCARYLMLFCSLGFVFLPTSYVWANPAGEQVVGGAATFQRDGNKLTVNQATDRLAVNWQSFNIGAGESTHFNMPSSTSAALNRVIGGNPSSIYGSLSANGILYLINPSGILVGPGGTVNAASFMASTLDVSTEQFMNAKNGAGMNFYGSSGESIINQGNITAEKGDVFLVAQKVENRGTINAANGTAGMVGSGQNTDVMVHEVGGKGFAIRVAQLQGEAATGSNRDLPDGEELLNEGMISAAQAELNASGNVYALAIKNSGTIRVKAVVANADGTVRLDGGLGDVMNTGTMLAKNAGNEAMAAGGKIDVAGLNITASPESIITAAGGEQGGNGGSVKIDSQDTTIVQGKVDVSAAAADAKGGKAQLLGERVGLLDGTKVDASGGAGGGTVLVGGDYLGGQTPPADLKNLAKQEAELVKNAKAVVMADTAEIKADATVNGDGGKVVLWSDEYTGFYGNLFARGGAQGGNGGFIETSSKDNLQAMGSGIASAANGTGGLWLLDPSNLVISSSASSGGSFNSGNPNVFTPDGTANTAVVNNATIQNSLNAGTDVTLLTSGAATGIGNITMTAGISKAATVSGTASTLTMIAAGSINISQAIATTDGGLTLVLGAQSGVTIGANIATLGGNLTIQGANAAGSTLSASTTTVTLSGGTVSTLGGTASGNLSITATGAVQQTGGSLLIKGDTTVTTGSGQSITLGGTANRFDGGVSFLTSSGNLANITFSDTTAMELQNALTISGNLLLTANGITQAGAVTIGGDSTFNSGIGSIDLSDENNFTGSVSLTGGNTTIRDASGLIFGTSTIIGSLEAFATAGAITQNGFLSVSNGASFTAATGQAITLAHLNSTTGLADNSFLGGISFLASSGNLSNINLVATTPVEIQSNLNITGNLSVTANGIAQSGVIAVGGTSAFNGGTGAIVLTNTGNTYGGTVTVSGGASADMFFRLADEGDVGPVTVAGTFTLRTASGTAFNLAGVGGTANFDVTDSILGNLSVGTLALVANGAAISSSSAYLAAGVDNLSLTTLASGAITLGATVTTGDLQLTSAGGNIAASAAANDFTGTVSASTSGTSTISITDINDLTLGVISLGTGALGLTFGKDLLNNLGLGLEGRIVTSGALNLTPNDLASDIILGATAGNANDIAGAVTINNPNNVRDFVLRNVNTGAGTIVNLAGATNLRDVSINYPLGTYSVPTFASTSFRDLSVYANTVTLGGTVTSNNGSIQLYQANSGGTFALANNLNTLAGDIRVLSDGNLTVNTGVVIGGQTTGAITLSADAGGLGAGALTLTGTATVGNANNSSVITLQSASVVIGATSSILQGAGTVVFKPSTLDADIDLGTVTGGAAPFSITGAELGRVFSSGTVEIGGESQVGDTNIGALSLTSNTFSTLKLVGSSASSALLGANTSWRTFGIGLDFDVNVDLGESLLVIDTTQAGFYPIGADILFGKQVDGDRTLDTSGASLSLTAGTSSVIFERSVGAVNPLAFLQVTQAGSITTGKITARQAGLFGAGGLISLVADTITTNGNLNVDAVTQGAGIGDAGGQISISGRNLTLNSRLSANGGDGKQSDTGANFSGGAAGDIFIRATGDLTVAPDPEIILQGSFSALGGDPSDINLAFGADGTIDLASGVDMFFKTSQVGERETQYVISAGRNLVFASNPDPVIRESAGGVSFRMNVDNTEVSKQPLTLNFNTADPIAGTGVLFMAPGSSIQTNGGQLNIVGEGGGITLADIDVINSPSFNLAYSGIADLLITGSVFGQNTSRSSGIAASGAVITINAPNSNLKIERGVSVQGNDFYGTGGGYAILEGKNVTVSTINASGGDDGDDTSQPGRGGEIRITANYNGSADSGQIVVTTLLARGGQSSDTLFGGQGGDGGKIDLKVGNGLQAQYINVEGGSSSDSGSLGGQGGTISIKSSRDLLVPAGLYAGGGSGTVVNGAAGTVNITTDETGADIAMSSGTITLSGNANLNISSAGSVTLGVISSYEIGNPFLDPFNISSGSNLTINSGSEVGDILGDLKIAYGTVDVGSRFYMPGSNTIRTTGGDISISRDSDSAPGGGLLGQALVGGIDTTLSNGDAGSVVINANKGGGPETGAVVIINGNITTSGGDAVSGTTTSPGGLLGFNGGSVQITGDTVSVKRIESSGGDSDATSANNSAGGTGGGITLTATSGTSPTITLQRNLTALGGTGLGRGDAYGGGGGSIQLNGNVVLSSGNSSTSTLTWSSSGGVGKSGGESGIGGAIVSTGSITGTTSTSNTLQLAQGSGTVILGDDSLSETITLGTLITATDDALSTGDLIINASLDLDTLTTYARGYGIEINGGGAIANAVTFNNTGTVAIGNVLAATTFTSGVEATAPSTTQLKGSIISGTSANPGQGTPLAFGVVTLGGATILDSNGSNVSLGTVDGGFDLTFSSGIGAGVVDVSSAVGASSRVGTIAVSTGISQPVLFRSSVTAAELVGAADTTISFDGNVDLTGRANLLGLTKLNNTLYASQNTTFSFTTGATLLPSVLSDVELSLGPVLIGGAGNYSFTGLFDGGVNLTLSGVGSKTFSGTVGGTTAIGTGTEAAITMSGGDVTFGALTTLSGLDSTANVFFNGVATLGAGNTGTTLNSNVTLSGATISSAGSVALGNDVGIDTITLDTGTVTLTGAGAYTVNVQMTGSQRLVLGGAGTKTFGSTVDVTGFTQDALSGTVTFQDDVTTSGVSLFSASTVLDNINFTSSGVGALGATAMNGVTLNGVVTLQGDGNYVFNGAMTGTALLALASEGTSTFESAVTVNRVDQSVSAGTATFRGDVTTGGASIFDGATVLDGMAFSAGGVTTMNGVTLSTGAVTLQGAGAYSIGGAVTGSQNMILAGGGAKVFNGTVSVGSVLLGITQANAVGNTVRFNNTVTTAGVSTFNRGVTLGTMTFNSGGATTMNDSVVLAGAATLQGVGSYTVNGAVGGGQNLTLAEAGTKAFNSTLNLGTFSQTGGKVSLGGGVTTSGAVNLATVGTTGDILVNSTGATQTYGSVTLAGDLTTATTSGDVDAVTFGPGGVTGSGNLSVQASGLALNGVVANRGLFSAETSGNIDLGGGYLSAIEVARIASTGGARFASLVGDVTAQNLTTSTSLSMQALNGETTVNGVIVNGALNMESGGAVNFNGNDTYASSLAFTGQNVSSDGSLDLLANIIVPSLGGITLTGSGNGLSYSPSGNLNVSGRISVNGGDITLDPSGNFVNSYAGNPFTANSTRILTKDLFSSWPSNGAVPGLQVVYGVNSIGQVGANQVGVSTTLLAGNAGPYILEFTTGTGQPYIFAQQAAIPPVMLPAALTGGNGFARTISYSADEIEMMTPEERSAYETQQRQVSARVILQGQSGEGEEIGAPTEGRTPQAAVPAVQIPVAPTAQVLLEGKPLAGAKSDQERGDAKRILKVRPIRAVALRSGLNVNEVMESERMAAEVSVGSAPVVQSR